MYKLQVNNAYLIILLGEAANCGVPCSNKSQDIDIHILNDDGFIHLWEECLF